MYLVRRKGALPLAGGYYGTALQALSWRGIETVARLLFEKGAEVVVQGGEYGNALQAATSETKEAVAMLS